jgi:hypothetical protein
MTELKIKMKHQREGRGLEGSKEEKGIGQLERKRIRRAGRRRRTEDPRSQREAAKRRKKTGMGRRGTV